ncbi:PAS domain S-box-containing protein [Lysobacter niastensis]|uniref:histidine kinase n=1 Tax=Lysobacter niastensis TaxID=380629 RepID=A0ABU1WAV3_9GAMM|nr:CHASE domain-containing protein [Lysobacter niastensis]MDR7134567.1 PAS domain S-box-containing protein [Lysobacter niastensis]
MDANVSHANELAELEPRRGYLLALVVLLGALILVFMAWKGARERELVTANAEFVNRANEITARLQQPMTNYELVARGGASLFASVARPTPAQWQAYVESMRIQPRFPGMVGLGFAGYIPGAELDDLQLQWRDSGYGMLQIRPHGIRPVYGPVLYLEPRTPENVEAVGYDMFSEPTRRAAMELALDTGLPQLSGPVVLIQDLGEQKTGMLLFIPLYRGGGVPGSRMARRQAVQGWVYVPIRLEPYLQAALGSAYREARFRIYDSTAGNERLMFANHAGGDILPAFRHSTTLQQYGRSWRIEFESLPLAEAAPRLQTLENLLALGLFACLLLYGIALVLAHTESRAHTIATLMTEDYRRSEQRFRVAMQYSAIGKALLDSDGRIVEANPSLGAIVGIEPHALIGVRFDTLFEDDEPGLGGAGGGTDAHGVHRTTRRLHREGGMPRHAQLTYAPVPGNVGQDIAGLVQAEDVTERLRAEARVHALNRTLEARVAMRTRELSQANQELEAFAYSISHDLRAPLRAIDGFSRTLAERYETVLDDAGRGYLSRVRRAAARMGELIDALLKMSRLSRSELKLERVDLSRMAGEIVEELRMGDSPRAVEAVIEPGLQVVGDATLLRNMLGNLLGNAWKFTRERPDARIEFGVSTDTEAVPEFFIKDNGAGFPQQYVDKLFRPFQRLHHEGQFAGHGIGLASVKRIVERHGGVIRAEGQEGEGATFFFTLPGLGRH